MLLVPPKFIKPLEEVVKGCFTQSSEFSVQICAKPSARIRVLKDNRELKSTDHIKFETEKINDNTVEFKIIIDNNQAADAGVYKIEAVNKCLTATSQTQLQIKGEPVLVRKPADSTAVEKKQSSFYCEAQGVPLPTVEWFKEGVLLEKTDNIQIEAKGKGIHQLLIKSVTKENVGKYTVKAKNESGEVESSFSLLVDGK